MWRVIHHFTDLQDSDHPYNAGDEYPRQGLSVSDERISELSGAHNKQRTPLIEEVAEPVTKVKTKGKKNDK